jgi:hypothetical protein
LLGDTAVAQPSSIGGTTDAVPRDVREIYEKGLAYLQASQTDKGNWSEGYSGPGTTGLAIMAFLACGEDPNFGQYSQQIRKGLRSLITNQDVNSGYMGDSMYQHGFALLALAEAYGAVDDQNLWEEQTGSKQRSVGEALELGVRCCITSQSKNPHQAWRYSPNARDADTSVSGAILMGLLAARNAGIEVPDSSIDKAINYFSSMTSDSGLVGYSGGMGGFGQSIARSSIACLVYSIAKRKDLSQFTATKGYVIKNIEEQSHYVEYARYYQAQALFQADLEAWEKWNRGLIRQLKATQAEDGSFSGQFGKATSTSLNLLSSALNFRFLPIYER